ncbi:MAG: 1-(5-phosphoribosyl)-5-[(5-phosphoribosylamino)methylideneamino]imidazole-4-carboxamide isomerase [Clostridiales bacterium]|nr:1-(5-phosphoribosyl)-5-[(5-phosphoribosylamino)methylideneamino]imidazole-4-carboxamide isomerase [Clostridiales bacterium]
MIIYPAIDLLNKQCVRLTKGKYDLVTVYSNDPMSFALKWKQTGAKYLHIVDLDGARNGNAINLPIIKKIAKKVNIPIQTGGGIRTLQRIEELLNCGVTRVIIGTKAVKDQAFVKKAISLYGEKIAIGIDAKDGYVAIDGWENTSDFEAVTFAKMMENLGVKTIIYTDISRDGMMQGPNVEAMKHMVDSTNLRIIASGGVSKRSDLDELLTTNVNGVIIGKALYEKTIKLDEVSNAY